MRSATSLLLFCSIFLCIGSTILAQDTTNISSPLMPGYLVKYHTRVGVLLGPSFNLQTGSFLTQCNCSFSDGAKTSFLIGGLYERQLGKRFNTGIRLTYEMRNLTAAYKEYETITLASPTSSKTFQEPILFRHEANASFSILALTPYIEWVPFWIVSTQVGLVPQFIVSSSIKHVKQIDQRTAVLDNGEVVYASFEGNQTSKTIEDGEFQGVNTFQVAAAASIGLDIPLSKKIFLMPLYQYIFPFTTLSTRGENFKINASQILIGLKMNIN